MGKGTPKHDGNCQLAPCVPFHLPLNLRYGNGKNCIPLALLEIRFHHADALLNLGSGKEEAVTLFLLFLWSSNITGLWTAATGLKDIAPRFSEATKAITVTPAWCPSIWVVSEAEIASCWWQVPSSTLTSGWQPWQWALPAYQAVPTFCKHQVPCLKFYFV